MTLPLPFKWAQERMSRSRGEGSVLMDPTTRNSVVRDFVARDFAQLSIPQAQEATKVLQTPSGSKSAPSMPPTT